MITKDMSILEVLQACPEARHVFEEHGMGCMECMGAEGETIEDGARMHGLNLDDLLKDLNHFVQRPN